MDGWTLANFNLMINTVNIIDCHQIRYINWQQGFRCRQLHRLVNQANINLAVNNFTFTVSNILYNKNSIVKPNSMDE